MTDMAFSPATLLHPLETEQLTDEQRRGAACAYCAVPVATGSAVDLGAHRDADGIRIFSRAHPACLGGAS